MSTAEDAVRTSLATRAQDEVLPGVVLLDRVHAGIARDAARRRRRTWTTALAAAACVALVVLAVGVVRPLRGSSAPAVNVSPSEPLQTITDRGLQVQVPASWPVNLSPVCGGWTHDVVDLNRFLVRCGPGGTTPAESAGRPVTRVAFSASDPAAGRGGARPARIDGHQAWRSEVPLNSVQGATAYVVDVPDVGGTVVVSTADPAVAQRILATVRVVGNDTVCGSVSSITQAELTALPLSQAAFPTLSPPAISRSQTVDDVQALARALCALPVETRALKGCGPQTSATWAITFTAGDDVLPEVDVVTGSCPGLVTGLGASPRAEAGVAATIRSTFRLPS